MDIPEPDIHEGGLDVEVVSVDGWVLRERVAWVELRTDTGLLEVHRGHLPMAASMPVGVVQLHLAPETCTTASVHGGFLEVREDRVRIAASHAETPETLEPARAARALERAVLRLEGDQAGVDLARALRAKLRAEARLFAVELMERGCGIHPRPR